MIRFLLLVLPGVLGMDIYTACHTDRSRLCPRIPPPYTEAKLFSSQCFYENRYKLSSNCQTLFDRFNATVYDPYHSDKTAYSTPTTFNCSDFVDYCASSIHQLIVDHNVNIVDRTDNADLTDCIDALGQEPEFVLSHCAEYMHNYTTWLSQLEANNTHGFNYTNSTYSNFWEHYNFTNFTENSTTQQPPLFPDPTTNRTFTVNSTFHPRENLNISAVDFHTACHTSRLNFCSHISPPFVAATLSDCFYEHRRAITPNCRAVMDFYWNMYGDVPFPITCNRDYHRLCNGTAHDTTREKGFKAICFNHHNHSEYSVACREQVHEFWADCAKSVSLFSACHADRVALCPDIPPPYTEKSLFTSPCFHRNHAQLSFACAEKYNTYHTPKPTPFFILILIAIMILLAILMTLATVICCRVRRAHRNKRATARMESMIHAAMVRAAVANNNKLAVVATPLDVVPGMAAPVMATVVDAPNPLA